MKEGPNTSHTVEFLDPHNSQPAEKMKVNMLNGKPIWTVLILQTIEHCQYGKTYGLFGWRGKGGGVEGSRVV